MIFPKFYLIRRNLLDGTEEVIKKGSGPTVNGTRIAMALMGDPNYHVYAIKKKDYEKRNAA